MSRSEQGKIVAVSGLGFSGAALGLHLYGWSVVMTAVVAGLCVAFFGMFYAREKMTVRWKSLRTPSSAGS